MSKKSKYSPNLISRKCRNNSPLSQEPVTANTTTSIWKTRNLIHKIKHRTSHKFLKDTRKSGNAVCDKIPSPCNMKLR